MFVACQHGNAPSPLMSHVLKRRQGAIMSHRTERDSMGELHVPADAYFGAQTARAVENFPISDLRLPSRVVEDIGIIKAAAAEVNHDLGLLDDRREELIQQACREVIDGKLDSQFVVDIFQTGS